MKGNNYYLLDILATTPNDDSAFANGGKAMPEL